MSDVNLIQQAQQGDRQALGTLYDQHQAALFRYVWLRVQDQQLAEDLTGDIFVRMLDALPRYRPTVIPFRAWLYRIAHNLVIDHYRRNARRAEEPLSVADRAPLPEADPHQLMEYHWSLEQIQTALNQLDEGQREVIALRFLAGLSLQETAALLNKTEAAVKAIQHRGLTALRNTLSHEVRYER